MIPVDKARISVIIPCYNGWKYIQKCFEHLENQSVLPYEVIVIDDCSTDDSFQRIEDYSKVSKLNIILQRNITNSGPGKSRQLGISVASGQYLSFCDSDDWFEKDFVESIQNAVNGNQPDLILFDNYIVFEDGKRYRQNRTAHMKNANKNDFLIESNLSLWRIVAKAELFQNLTHVDLRHEEDSVLVIQLLSKASSIDVIDNAYYNYFFREGSLSKKDSPDIYKDERSAFYIIENFLKSDYPEETEFIGVRYICYSSVLYALRAGVKRADIKLVIDEFERKYPFWFKNKYICSLPIAKRTFIQCVRHKALCLAKVLASFHHIMAKLKRFA